MTDKTPTELDRVLARQLATPLTTDALSAVSGGQTAYPCGDQPDKITQITDQQQDASYGGGGDCAIL